MRLIDADALPIHKFPVTERDHLCEAIAYRLGWNNAIEAICENEPTAEKTSEWIKNDNGTWTCKNCQAWIPDEQHYYARYCLYCGAKMEGEK